MLTGNTSITQPRLPAGISRKSPSLSPLFLHPPTIFLSLSLSLYLSLYHSLCETASRIFCPSPSVSGTHPRAICVSVYTYLHFYLSLSISFSTPSPLVSRPPLPPSVVLPRAEPLQFLAPFPPPRCLPLPVSL